MPDERLSNAPAAITLKPSEVTNVLMRNIRPLAVDEVQYVTVVAQILRELYQKPDAFGGNHR